MPDSEDTEHVDIAGVQRQLRVRRTMGGLSIVGQIVAGWRFSLEAFHASRDATPGQARSYNDVKCC